MPFLFVLVFLLTGLPVGKAYDKEQLKGKVRLDIVLAIASAECKDFEKKEKQ